MTKPHWERHASAQYSLDSFLHMPIAPQTLDVIVDAHPLPDNWGLVLMAFVAMTPSVRPNRTTNSGTP